MPLDFRARENLPFGLCWRLGVLTSVTEFVDRAADGDRRFAAAADSQFSEIDSRKPSFNVGGRKFMMKTEKLGTEVNVPGPTSSEEILA